MQSDDDRFEKIIIVGEFRETQHNSELPVMNIEGKISTFERPNKRAGNNDDLLKVATRCESERRERRQPPSRLCLSVWN